MSNRILFLLISMILAVTNDATSQLQSITGQLLNGKGTFEKLDHVRVAFYLNDKLIGNEYTDELGQLANAFNIMTENLDNTTVSRNLLLQEITERKKSELERQKLEEQIKLIQEQGLTITHLDSHEHVHMLPGVLSIVII